MEQTTAKRNCDSHGGCNCSQRKPRTRARAGKRESDITGLREGGNNRNSVGGGGSVFLGKFGINGTEHSDTQKHSCFRSVCFRDDLLKFCA